MAKIKEILSSGVKTVISLEVTPPEKGSSIYDIFRPLDRLMDYSPQFINVTYHQPYVEYVEENGELIKRILSKKPGTVGVSSAIQNRYGVDAVPHIICGGQSRYTIEDTIADLTYLGIENVFAVRGDAVKGQVRFTPEKDGYSYASELVEGISRSGFCIGVAGYPEKHSEAVNMEKDMLYLKKKVESGADYIITQMSFDAGAVKDFENQARELGLSVPVIPGIKPVISMSQIKKIPSLFGVKIPQKMKRLMENSRTPKEEFDNGIKYMAGMVEDLLRSGFGGVHIFTMGRGAAAKALLDAVFGGKA